MGWYFSLLQPTRPFAPKSLLIFFFLLLFLLFCGFLLRGPYRLCDCVSHSFVLWLVGFSPGVSLRVSVLFSFFDPSARPCWFPLYLSLFFLVSCLVGRLVCLFGSAWVNKNPHRVDDVTVVPRRRGGGDPPRQRPRRGALQQERRRDGKRERERGDEMRGDERR